MSSASTSSTSATAAAAPSERELLRQHFDAPFVQHNTLWDSLWQKGDFLPWDKGEPGQALVDTLAQRKDLLGTPVGSSGGEKKRKRALVPGCGRGYDVLFLSSIGYDAYGLEISANAIKACQDHAKKEYYTYLERAAGSEAGSYTFVQGDFFKDAWVKELNAEHGFDLVYDYTVCFFPCPQRSSADLPLVFLRATARDASTVGFASFATAR